MTIGEAARKAGLPAKTIRYYEDIGLIGAASRTAAGYRVYSTAEIRKLQFIQRARNLGFSVKQVRELLALWQDRERNSADSKAVAEAHIAEIDERMAELNAMRDALSFLVERCHGDHRPNCPILEDLAGDIEARPQTASSDGD